MLKKSNYDCVFHRAERCYHCGHKMNDKSLRANIQFSPDSTPHPNQAIHFSCYAASDPNKYILYEILSVP